MTEPTDKELDELRQANGGKLNFVTLSEFRTIARAALAKWGAQPVVPAGYALVPAEPTPEMVDAAQEAYMPFGDMALAIQLAIAAAPQPVVREPLTCEWAHNEDDGFWDTECGQSWRFDDGGPKENNMNFCHCCGKTLRIKGKEAVNADT